NHLLTMRHGGQHMMRDLSRQTGHTAPRSPGPRIHEVNPTRQGERLVYQQILVALDGSELAEQILPHVEALGRALGSTLIVLRATTPPERIIAEVHSGAMLPAAGIIDPEPIIVAEREEVDGYLAKVAERLRASGLTV